MEVWINASIEIKWKDKIISRLVARLSNVFLFHFDGLLTFGYHNSICCFDLYVILTSLQHLRKQYNELFPALCNDHPAIFPKEFYSWEEFLWACELWYSNSLKIMFPDGHVRTCLVPIAGFLNHSVCVILASHIPYVIFSSLIGDLGSDFNCENCTECSSIYPNKFIFNFLPQIDFLVFVLFCRSYLTAYSLQIFYCP